MAPAELDQRAGELVEPAHLWVPERSGTAGGEAVDLAASYGLHLDAEQQLAVDAMLSESSPGRWAALETAIVVPRQNGKTVTLQAIALHDLFLGGAELIVWTAHLFRTAQEAFLDVKGFVENYDHLRRRVRRVSEANGEEGIELLSGARLNFLARSKSSGRGLSGDRVILDEAFALSAGQMGALFPTLSARPNPQLVYASSAGLVDSDILRGVRDRGRAGGDEGLVYLEWCAPDPASGGGCDDLLCEHGREVPGCALDRVEHWRAANPALGKRISVSFIRGERRALPPAEFARERLGWWDDASAAEKINPVVWAQLADPDAALPSDVPVRFGIDVAPDSASASIAAAGALPEGGLHGEVVEHQDGTGWVVARVLELAARWPRATFHADGAGPVNALLPELVNAGVTVEALGAREVVAACGLLQRVVTGRLLQHRGDPIMTTALAGAGVRAIGDAWAFRRISSAADISPLVAFTVAVWAAEANRGGDPLRNIW